MKNFHQSGKAHRINGGKGGVDKSKKNFTPTESKYKTQTPSITEKETSMTIEVKPTSRNAIYPAKDIFTLAPDAIFEFINKGNTVFIPMDVILWLEASKRRSDIGLDAIDAIENIQKLQKEKNESLVIFDSKPSKISKSFIKDDINLRIIEAAIKKAKDSREGFDKVKFVSRTPSEQIIATHKANGSTKLIVGDYFKDNVSVALKDSIPEATILSKYLTNKYRSFPASLIENHERFSYNDGIIISSDYTPGVNDLKKEITPSFAAIRKNDHFEIVSPNISAAGIGPYSKDGTFNWSQLIALSQLLDERIPLSIVTGRVGSGKTLLAVASGIEQVLEKKYDKLIITRPMVPFGDEETMGFLPGTKAEKMHDYLQPIYDAIDLIVELNPKIKSKIDFLRTKKIIIESLNFIRGRTFRDCYIIVDESQNATPYQSECVMERVGEGSKVVLVGDPYQVDKRDLGKRSNGLVVAIDRMNNDPLVSICTLQSNERSALSRLVHKRFNLAA